MRFLIGLDACLENAMVATHATHGRWVTSSNELKQSMSGLSKKFDRSDISTFLPNQINYCYPGTNTYSTTQKVFEIEDEHIVRTQEGSSSLEKRAQPYLESIESFLAKQADFAILKEIFLHRIVFFDGAALFSNTDSRYPGTVLISPATVVEYTDIVEAFVHELTHLVLFYDEMRYQHWLSDTYTSRPVTTAILGRKTEPAVAAHSLIVAHEVVALRNAYLGHQASLAFHPPTDVILERSKACWEELMELHKSEPILAPRGEHLINVAAKNLGLTAAGSS